MKIIFQEPIGGDLLNPKHIYALMRHGNVVGLVKGNNRDDALREIVNHHSFYHDLDRDGESCYRISRNGKRWILRHGWSLRRLSDMLVSSGFWSIRRS